MELRDLPHKTPPIYINPNIPMGDAHGIQETKDVIIAADRLAVAIIHAVRDGRVNVSDAVEIASDSEVRQALLAAAQGVTVIPDEIGDLSVQEIKELSQAALDVPFNVLGALKE